MRNTIYILEKLVNDNWSYYGSYKDIDSLIKATFSLASYQTVDDVRVRQGTEMGIKKYIKKPIIIEAIQFTGDKENYNEILNFVDSSAIAAESFTGGQIENIWIRTLEGIMTVSLNDYIIKGVHGEFYPCKPDIFNETYDKIEDDKND